MKTLQKFAILALAMAAAAPVALAQGGCISFPTPPAYQLNPSATNVYRVAAGINASGAPVTTTPIYSDSSLATVVTQTSGVVVPSPLGAATTICAPAGPYTVQFNSSAAGLGFFNYNVIVPADASKQQVLTTGAAYTNATTTFSDVTGLLMAIKASKNYTMDCHILWQGSAGTTGPKYQFTGPASPTAVAANAFSAVTATTVTQASAVAFASSMPNAGTVTTATNFMDEVRVSVLNGVNDGTVQLQAAANGAGTLTIQPGSFCVATGL